MTITCFILISTLFVGMSCFNCLNLYNNYERKLLYCVIIYIVTGLIINNNNNNNNNNNLITSMCSS